MPERDATTRVQLDVDGKTVWKIALNVLAILAAIAVLRSTRQVVTWILVALFIALALDPAVGWLERRGLRRGLAVLVTLVGVVAFLALFIVTLVPMFVEQAKAFAQAAPGMLEGLRASRALAWADQHFDVIERAKRELSAHAGAAAGGLLTLAGSVVSAAVGTITVIALSTFMLLFGGKVFAGLLSWIAPSEQARWALLAGRARRTVGAYVGGTLVVALSGGVVTSLILVALGVPYFLPLGFAMVVLGIVPYIGSAIGAVLVVCTTLLTTGMKAAVIALVAFLGYQQVEGQLLQPLVQKRTIRMNPLLIVLAMLIGTSHAGVMGALLALPVAGIAQIVLEDVLGRRRLRWREPANGGEEEHDDEQQLVLPGTELRPAERPT